MSEFPIHFIVRKKQSSTLITWLWVLGIASFIFLFVSASSDSNIMEDLLGYFFVFGILFILAALVVHDLARAKLIIAKNENDRIQISITRKKGTEFELTAPFRIQCIHIEVPTGASGAMRTMPELYLIFMGQDEKPLLSLKTNPGILASFPEDFAETPLGTVSIQNIYTCHGLLNLYQTLKDLPDALEADFQ